MIDTKALKQKILDLAIHGKLVPQDPSDEPASVLLEKIRTEKQRLIKEGKIKSDKSDSIIYKGDDNRYYENLPSGWVEAQLNLVCWLEDGEKKSGEKLIYWDAKALRGETEAEYVTSGKVVEQNRNVILVDGENSGEVFLVPYKGYLGSTFKLLVFNQFVDVEYIKLILDYQRVLFRENKTGSAIPHLNKKLFRTLPIILPPLAEQSRIVLAVRNNFIQIDIVERNRTELEQLYDKLKKKTLDLAIRGKLVPQDPNDEPASELLKRIRTEKKAQLGKKYVDSYIYKGDDNCYYEHIDGKANDEAIEVPFELSENWCWTRLGNIIHFQGGYAYKSDSYVKKSKCQIIRLGNVKLNELIIDKKQVYISEEIASITSDYLIKENDILVTMTGTRNKRDYFYSLLVEKEHLTTNQLFLNQRVGCIRGNKRIHYKYLLSVLQCECIKDLIFAKETGTANQGNIGSEDMKRFILIPIPPYAEQKRIVNKIKEMFEKL